MKNKASGFLKQIMALLSSIGKAKSMAAGLKSKTSSMRARLAVISLLMKNKKAALLAPISDKIKSLAQLGHHHHHQADDDADADADAGGDDPSKLAIVLYNGGGAGGTWNGHHHRCCWSPPSSSSSQLQQLYLPPPPLLQQGENEDEIDDDKYPDLTHTLFDENDCCCCYYMGNEDVDDDDGKESVIDIVRNSKALGGEEFRLEDEIDEVADLFITRFHKQMRMQKLQSFKRRQEMLHRSL